jgi:2-methylfumaryl-CoA hydratase
MSKTSTSRFFEDFRVGEIIRHATPRTIGSGDTALYAALYGSRFALHASEPLARAIGYPRSPVDDLLVFHMVLGKSATDLSGNAVANLGHLNCRFRAAVYPGDTLSAESEIIGLRENANREAGIVWARTRGSNDRGDCVLDFVRLVMVRKRGQHAPAPAPLVPETPDPLTPDELGDACPIIDPRAYETWLSGSPYRAGDYMAGERIDHVDGVTIEEAEHQLATRLYQSNAPVHFNQLAQAAGRFGRRLVYGGHVMSIARALSFNGLGNAFHIAAINGGSHVAPVFAGDTIFAWSEILDTGQISGRDDVGAVRVRTIATKNRPCADFPDRSGGAYDPSIVLDLDYWVLLPR